MIEVLIPTLFIAWSVFMSYILFDMAITDYRNNKEYRKKVRDRGW